MTSGGPPALVLDKELNLTIKNSLLWNITQYLKIGRLLWTW